MKDKMGMNISGELRHYIEMLAKEVVLEGKDVENHKKYLRRYLKADGIDFTQFEIYLSELFKTAEELMAQESKNNEHILRMLCKDCFLSDDQSTKLISTINKKRSNAEAKRRAEEDAERKAKEKAEAKRRAEEDAKRKAIEDANRRAKEAELRAKEEAERILREKKENERKEKEKKEIKIVDRMVIIHHGLLIIMVLLISFFEFATFKKWGWAFIPLLVNIIYSFYRIINVMDYCYGKKEFHKYEFALSFITIMIINIAAFCFPNAWSLAVLIPIPIISFMFDSAIHKIQKDDQMKATHNGLMITMVMLISYIEFANFDSWGWAFVPLIVNIVYTISRISIIDDLSIGGFKTREFAWTFITILIINVAAFCFPNAWSLALLIPILIISLLIDGVLHGI